MAEFLGDADVKKMAEDLSSSELYRLSLQAIFQRGDEVSVRGHQTKEVINFITQVDPYHHCVIVPGRRWNPWVALSEALWILAGRDDLAPLLPYNKRMAEFSDDGETLYGAYGKRMMWQVPMLLNRLTDDHHDRRAVLSIWQPADLYQVTKDPPCNDMVMFKLRKNKLHMTVMNRSNDLHWGLYGVNLPTFGILQDYIAAYLGVDMGTQLHISNSLHIYTGGPGMKENWKITERMMAAAWEPLPEMPDHKRAFTGCVEPDVLSGQASAALGDATFYGEPFLEFAHDYLMAFRQNAYGYNEQLGRHVEDYQDWMLAAQVWRAEGVDRFK